MRIFLSSTYVDLKEIRNIAINYLEDIVGHITDATGTVVAMEYFNATERYCKEECLHELSTCNLVIGIYGDRYGTPAEDGRSMTETEFDYAVEHNIPILAFVKREECRDAKQQLFISKKVHGSGKSCANFEKEVDFADRLSASIKEYLGQEEYDGYSVDSLWEQVTALRGAVQKRMENNSSGVELQMLPYGSGDEDIALENILSSVKFLKESIQYLEVENTAVHPYAYTVAKRPSELTVDHGRELCKNVAACANQIVANWELIHLGIVNHTTAITLATTYLKLKRMQQRLLDEPWTEELRQEVLRVRTEYIDTIHDSRYVD